MKNKFILGFITGGIICATATGFAVEYVVTANPFPVAVNGTETAIEGYNINDNTYFKLRDVADAVGGFNVGFSDNTITIDTDTAAEPTPTPTTTAAQPKPTLNPNKEYYYPDLFAFNTDDGLPVYNFDGTYYLNCLDIIDYTDFDWHKFDDNYCLEYNTSMRFISYEYYTTVVLANPTAFKN